MATFSSANSRNRHRVSLWKKLTFAAMIGAAISAIVGIGRGLVGYCATSTYRTGLPAEALARLRSQEISDATADVLKLAEILVPFCFAVAWLAARRRGKGDQSSS